MSRSVQWRCGSTVDGCRVRSTEHNSACTGPFEGGRDYLYHPYHSVVSVKHREGTHTHTYIYMGFPDNSVGKEPACNAGDPGSILGSGRSTGKGLGYPFQYSWVSLVAQLVKNPPAMGKTWVQSLGWEDSLEKGKATHSSILAQRIP